MKKHDESRRAFLIGAAMGAAATHTLVPDAIAQTTEQHAVAAPAEGAAHGHGAGHGAFFNDDDAATVTAFAERLMPGAPGKPGATELDFGQFSNGQMREMPENTGCTEIFDRSRAHPEP